MKIAIVGGYGQMGRWFARFLKREGKEVVIIGRDESKLKQAGAELGVAATSDLTVIKTTDAVLLSVPIDSFEGVIKQIALYTHPKLTVLDVTSIKAMPVEMMHRYLGKNLVLGTHPMFGPGARTLKNQNVVLTPTAPAESELAQKVREFLEAREAIVTVMTPEEHDKTMAVTLGLAHFIALVSADTLLSLDNLGQSRQIAGTTFKVLLTLIEGVISRDPDFYATLQTSLNVADIEQLFQRKAGEWAGLVKAKNKPAIMQRMDSLRKQFEKADPDFARAYDNMYKLIDGK